MKNPSEMLRELAEANNFETSKLYEVIEEMEKIEARTNRNITISAIRTYLTRNDKEQNIEVAISAMRENELLSLIFRYDSTESDVVKAYHALNRLDPNKYKKIEL